MKLLEQRSKFHELLHGGQQLLWTTNAPQLDICSTLAQSHQKKNNSNVHFSSQKLEFGGGKGQFARGGDAQLYGLSKVLGVVSSMERKEGKDVYHALTPPPPQ